MLGAFGQRILVSWALSCPLLLVMDLAQGADLQSQTKLGLLERSAVMIAEFWTYSCSSCISLFMHSFPYIKRLLASFIMIVALDGVGKDAMRSLN